jgi:hypothetical protein
VGGWRMLWTEGLCLCHCRHKVPIQVSTAVLVASWPHCPGPRVGTGGVETHPAGVSLQRPGSPKGTGAFTPAQTKQGRARPEDSLGLPWCVYCHQTHTPPYP